MIAEMAKNRVFAMRVLGLEPRTYGLKGRFLAVLYKPKSAIPRFLLAKRQTGYILRPP